LAGKRKVARGAPRLRKGGKLTEPSWEDYDKLTGEQFHRKRQGSHQWYYENYKTSDLMPAVWAWMERNGYSKEDIKKAKIAPESVISTTAAIVCKMLNNGMPETYKPAAEYWDSLPGTTGELKPASEFVKKRVEEALNAGQQVKQEQEKKEEEQRKIEKYIPSIQERIREATYQMTEFIEQAHDDFISGKIEDFKDIKVATRLRQVECKQPHARLIKSFYDDIIQEYNEVLNPPSTKNMSELEKDYVAQLKEGYANFTKPQIKKLLQFYLQVQGACDAIIAESKANRKPRKVSAKSPEKIVEKIKYKVTDDKYAVSSIPAAKLVGSNCLVVFNVKTRKLGIYYTSVEDPLGSGRDGAGLTVKGTTLQRFDDEKSVACTLRKPTEQLQEVKTLNTRKKFENWFAKLTTTPVKMNGRINPETVLIAAY